MRGHGLKAVGGGQRGEPRVTIGRRDFFKVYAAAGVAVLEGCRRRDQELIESPVRRSTALPGASVWRRSDLWTVRRRLRDRGSDGRPAGEEDRRPAGRLRQPRRRLRARTLGAAGAVSPGPGDGADAAGGFGRVGAGVVGGGPGGRGVGDRVGAGRDDGCLGGAFRPAAGLVASVRCRRRCAAAGSLAGGRSGGRTGGRPARVR